MSHRQGTSNNNDNDMSADSETSEWKYPLGSWENPICIDSDPEVDEVLPETTTTTTTPPPTPTVVQEKVDPLEFGDHVDSFPATPPPTTSRDYWQEAQNIFSNTGFDEDVDWQEVFPLDPTTGAEDIEMCEIPPPNQVDTSARGQDDYGNEPESYINIHAEQSQTGRGVENNQTELMKNVAALYSAEPLGEDEVFDGQVRDRSFLLTVNEGADELVRADNSELFGVILQDLIANQVDHANNFHVGLTVVPYEESTAAADGQDVRPFYVSFKPSHQMTNDMLSKQISSRFQSGGMKMFDRQTKLRVIVTTADFQSGSGRKRPDMRKLLNRQLDLVHTIKKTKPRGPGESADSYKNITKNQVTKLCLATAVLQAIAYIDWKNQEIVSWEGVELYRKKQNRWWRTRDINSAVPGRYSDLFDEAKAMLQRAGIQKETDFTLEDDVDLLQESMPHYTLVVMGEQHTDDPLYVGTYGVHRKTIALLLRDGHYQFIKMLPAFMKCRFFCVGCNVRGNNKMLHYKCKWACQRCMALDCARSQNGVSIRCGRCSVVFNDPACFERHLERGPLGRKSYCEHTKKCKDCKDLYYTVYGDRHVCNSTWCKRCKCVKPDDHRCYMTTVGDPPQSEFKRIYFDFETATYKEDGRNHHRVVAAVAFRSCSQCHDQMPETIQQAVDATCANCCGSEKKLTVFEEISPENRHDVIEVFVKWLFRRAHAGYACVAHNLKSFDGQFILREMLKNHLITPANKLITEGRKINGIIMKNKQRLLDSFNFVPFGLAAFPKAFGVRSWNKGEFPYAFIRPENYDYVGPVPDISYYKLDHMKPTRAAEIARYHAEKRAEDYEFNFYNEIMNYCITDVLLLAAGMTQFEKKFFNATNVVLFEECLTAASAALKTFRRRFLGEDLIELDEVPKGVSKRTSAIADRYLIWRSAKEQKFIHTRLNGGEHQIPGTNYFVDGFIPPCNDYPHGLAIEVKGCYHHACPLDYPDHCLMRGITTAREVRERDSRRESAIRQTGCLLECIWTHQIEEMKKSDATLERALLYNLDIGPLCPGEALVGGHTEGHALKKVADWFGILRYCDFISLYPTVMKYDPYPRGAHRVIRGDAFTVPITHPDGIFTFGLISCAVRPPERLRIPVLPVKGKKLLFKLCGSCQTADEVCQHTGEERHLYGTWTTVELKLAIEMGYIIEKVFAAQHYDQVSQYLQEGDNITTSIFSEYVDYFLKFKQEASGLPRDQMSDDEVLAYVEEYYRAEGVRLEVMNIFHDPVGRQVAKLLLNSLWGKLAERLDRRETQMISRVDDLYRLLRNPRLEVFPGYLVGKKRMLVSFSTLEECQEAGANNAMVHGVFTTSHARVRLYRAMMMLPDPQHLIYCDTDSLVYWSPWNQDPLQELYGQFLGNMTDEVGADLYISKFVTLGPKTYAYEVRRRVDHTHVKNVVKCKGFPLTRASEQQICLDEMERIVDQVIRGEEPTTLVVEYHNITRNSMHQLYNQVLRKQFRFTFDKRRLIGGGSTLPIGWKDAQL